MEKWLSGKKTYIVAGCALIAAVATWANGYVGGEAAAVVGVIATLAATLRAAITKSGPVEEE